MTEPIGSAPLVTVRGEAQLEGPPDLATIMLTLHASADTAERTRAQLAKGSAEVAELLQRFEAVLERSSTSGVHVYPSFNRRTRPRSWAHTGRGHRIPKRRDHLRAGVRGTAVRRGRCAVDYTNASAVKENMWTAVHAGVHAVVGSSGLNADDYKELDHLACGRSVGVVAASNLRLAAILQRAAAFATEHR